MSDRVIPKPGDRVRYVIEGTVQTVTAHRILGIRADDGHRWNLPYDLHGLWDEDGVTLTVLEPATAPP